MRLRREDSLLLVVDVQEKLAPHVMDHERLSARCAVLARAASAFPRSSSSAARRRPSSSCCAPISVSARCSTSSARPTFLAIDSACDSPLAPWRTR